MRDSKFGKLLLGIGITLGVAAGIALVLGFKPSRLPPALLDIAAYKLVFISVAVLMASGAALRRYARQSAPGQLAQSFSSENAPGALGEGSAEPLDLPDRGVRVEQLNTPR